MKIAIFVLFILLCIVGYFLFMNVMAYIQKKNGKEEDNMDFYYSYQPKYETRKIESREQSYQTHQNDKNVPGLPSFFTVLGFTEIPTEEELKKRYRQLVKKEHPDRGGDVEKYEEITKAYKEATIFLKS